MRERKITSKWTWEEALRAIITHPNYKCIPTLQERKASFQRYCVVMKSVEEEEARLQSLAIKEAFKSLLASDPKITSDTKWSEIVDKYGKTDAFLSVPTSRERVQLFEEYQSELRRSELEIVWARRKAATAQISEILKEMNLILDFERGKLPDWFDVKDKLIGILPDVDPVEYLLAFEEHVQELFKEFQAIRRAEKQAELLKELEYRELFNNLLKELEESEQLNPFSTWTSTYPLLKDRPEYKNLIGIYLYGSSPIDLFYDFLDKIQQNYIKDRKIIGEYFCKEFDTCEAEKLPKKLRSFTQFKDILKSFTGLEGQSVKFAYIELYGLDAISSDRLRINAFKHLLKHLSTPIKQTDEWNETKIRLEGKAEYIELPCDEDGEIYFLKFKKWLAKHTESDGRDLEGERGRERENYHDRDRDRSSKKSRWDKRNNEDTFEREREKDRHHYSSSSRW